MKTFGEELCEAWGLDADKVTRIEVVVEPLRPPYANVEVDVDGEMQRKLLELRPVVPA